MGKLLNYNGEDKVKKRIADVLNVTDVQNNGVSVVDNNGIANLNYDPSSIIHKDTTDNWNAQSSLVSQSGHIYVYIDKDVVDGVNIPAIKIGDGLAYLIDMPFVDSNVAELRDHIDNTTMHITQAERDFWNNKISCDESQILQYEKVIFKKN